MIRMCDTMQTWKWGGFGLGWRVGGEREGEDSLQTGCALCGAAGCAALEASLRSGGGPAPRALPAGGAIGRGCDGGTAAVTSLAVGTRRTAVLLSPQGDGDFGWRCGQVVFLQGADGRGVVAG